jgi:hypothetical protein
MDGITNLGEMVIVFNVRMKMQSQHDFLENATSHPHIELSNMQLPPPPQPPLVLLKQWIMVTVSFLDAVIWASMHYQNSISS